MLSHRIFDTTKLTLWIFFWLAVIFFMAMFNPKAPPLRASADTQHARDIAAESSLCEKRGKPFGSAEHMQCLLDVQE